MLLSQKYRAELQNLKKSGSAAKQSSKSDSNAQQSPAGHQFSPVDLAFVAVVAFLIGGPISLLSSVGMCILAGLIAADFGGIVQATNILLKLKLYAFGVVRNRNVVVCSFRC